MFFSAFVTPATPRTPAGGRACGTPSPMGGSLVFRPRLIRRCPRIRATFAGRDGEEVIDVEADEHEVVVLIIGTLARVDLAVGIAPGVEQALVVA